MEDYPRNLAEFEARFATEQACREYLCQLRWPEGFRCPRCGHDKAWAVRTALLECAGCHSRRHAGFNGRWDEMSKAEQEAMGANLRNVWTISTFGYPEAHFATFPPALVEPCIKAGTSEEGCCAACGSPFEHETAGFNRRLEAVHSSLGWQPRCVCDAGDPAPAVVLDPFAGAGTVGLVAARLVGRNAILIELNPEYAEMARRRIHEDAPLFADVWIEAVPKESHETAQLFAD